MIELFIEFIDSIYWIGYAQWLSEEHPEQYEFELKLFRECYE